LRSNENRIEKAHYIRMNPVRKGLCQTPEEWPYCWTDFKVRPLDPPLSCNMSASPRLADTGGGSGGPALPIHT